MRTNEDFSRLTQRKARKELFCYLCGEAIRPGQEFIELANRTRGRLTTADLHIHCHALCGAYASKHQATDYPCDNVLDWIEQTVCSECAGHKESCFAPTCKTVFRELLKSPILEAATASADESHG